MDGRGRDEASYTHMTRWSTQKCPVYGNLLKLDSKSRHTDRKNSIWEVLFAVALRSIEYLGITLTKDLWITKDQNLCANIC